MTPQGPLDQKNDILSIIEFLAEPSMLFAYICAYISHTWAPAGGGGRGGKLPPPPETEKIVVEKWCNFPELYKMTEVPEEGIENG